jgi:hypothetical protein
VIVADAMAVNSSRVVEETLEVLDTVAATGPNEEELDDERRFAERSLRDPNEVPGQLFFATASDLLGAEFKQPAEHARGRAGLSSEDVARALREALDTLLVIAPPDTERPERLEPYPLESRSLLTGRVHHARGFGLRRSRLPQLVVGADGVVVRPSEERHVTARFEDCVVALRTPDGSRTLLTRDGFFVTIDPSLWRHGREVTRAIDEALPEAVTVRMDPGQTVRLEAVEEVAHASLKRRWLVSEELELLPDRLEEGELPIRFLSATKGIRAGLLAATDRRIVFLARIFGEEWLEWPYDRVRGLRRSRGFWGAKLRIELEDGDVVFGELKKRDVDAFIAAVRPLLDRS